MRDPDVDGLIRHAAELARSGRFAASVAARRGLVALHPKEASHWVALGADHCSADDFPSACVVFARAALLSRDSRQLTATHLRPIQLRLQGYEMAERHGRAVVCLSPQTRAAHASLAASALRRGDLGRAAVCLQRGILVGEAWPDGWRILADAHTASGATEEAITALRQSSGAGALSSRRMSEIRCAFSSHDPGAETRGTPTGAFNAIYRISDAGYPRPKLAGRQACLRNFIEATDVSAERLAVVADNCSDATVAMIEAEIRRRYGSAEVRLFRTRLGNGPSWMFALDEALKGPDGDYVYLVEDDYLHVGGIDRLIREGLSRADYVSLYDASDKYKEPVFGGNPVVSHGGEVTRLILTKTSHWKFTVATTMTFAARLSTLRRDRPLLEAFAARNRPDDFGLFTTLISRGRTLITPVPGRATHAEPGFLSPLVDWAAIAAKYESKG
jgi:hypothetical protein